MMRACFTGIFVLLVMVSAVWAQDECGVIERAAAAESRVLCAELEAGILCYGNSPLTLVTSSEHIPDFRLPGDRTSVTTVAELNGGQAENAWAVALALVEAYQPQRWQLGEAAWVLLGDVWVQNLGRSEVDVGLQRLVVTAAEGANVRSGPGLEFRVLTRLFQEDSVRVDGRTADGQWLRLRLRDGGAGWIAAQVVTDPDADLSVVERGSDVSPWTYPPLTDLILETAMMPACDGAPDSGLLLQTPDDDVLEFRVNGISLEVQGTVFLQASEADALNVYILEGEAALLIGDSDYPLVEAQMARVVPTDDDIITVVNPYDYARMSALPLTILPRWVYAALDLREVVTPRPASGDSPLAGLLASDRCTITTGPGGSNLRGGPGTEYPLRGVMDFRESAHPVGRATGRDGQIWWMLAPQLYIRADTTVTGGDCINLPQVDTQALPPLPN